MRSQHEGSTRGHMEPVKAFKENKRAVHKWEVAELSSDDGVRKAGETGLYVTPNPLNVVTTPGKSDAKELSSDMWQTKLETIKLWF